MSVLKASDLFASDLTKEGQDLVKIMRDLAEAQLQIQKNAAAMNAQMQESNATRAAAIESTEQLTAQSAQLLKQEEEIKKLQEQIQKLVKKNTEESERSNEERIRARVARQRENKEIRQAIELEETEVRSIARLRAENKRLTQLRNRVSTDTEEGRERIAELNSEINENNDIIRENVDALSQQRLGIGGYAEAIQESIPALGDATSGVRALQQQFLSLLANPIVALIAAIAGGLILLGKAFKRTEQGQKTFAKATAGVNSALNTVMGKVSEFSLSLVKAFEDPEKAINDFWEFLKTNLINRLEALGLTAIQFGKVFTGTWETITKALISGKEARNAAFEELTENAGKLGQALIQFQTGLDTEQQGKFVEGVKDLTEEMKVAAKVAGELAILKFELFEAEQQARITSENLQTLAEVQASIADDATRSFQDRQAAAEKAEEASIKQANTEINLAKQRLEIANAELAEAERTAERNEELIAAQTDAQAELIAAERTRELAIIETQKRISELRQDDFEQNLDFIIDVADVQKTVNERRIADERLTLNARQVIFEETKKLLNDSFDQQLALFESENEIQLERAKLAELNNKEIFEYARGLQLSEIETNRLLEVIRERRLAEQDLSNLQKDLSDEEIERLKKAEETILNINTKNLIEGAKTLDKKRQIEIDSEKARVKGLLDSEVLLDREKEALELQHQQRLDEIDQEYTNKKRQREKEAFTQSADILNQTTSLAQGVFDFQNSLRDSEIQALEQKNERDLELLTAKQEQELEAAQARGEDTTALEEKQQKDREKLQKKQEDEEKKLRKRQAEAEKKQRIFSAVIDTAAAIAKTAGNLGFPAAIPAIALVGALGALQVATISATPIPAFADGGEMTEDGKALYAEAGRELLELPDGNMFLAETPTISEVPKGTKFYSNPETERMLNEAGGMTVQKLDEINGGIKDLKGAVEKKPKQVNYNWTESGLTKSTIDNGSVINHNEIYYNP